MSTKLDEFLNSSRRIRPHRQFGGFRGNLDSAPSPHTDSVTSRDSAAIIMTFPILNRDNESVSVALSAFAPDRHRNDAPAGAHQVLTGPVDHLNTGNL